MKEKGFTLIELLIVLALIAILATILIVIIKPTQIFIRGRDTQRQGDLRNLSAAVDAYIAEAANNPSLGWCTTNTISFSTTTTTILPGWPPTTSAYTVTGTNSVSATGTGWVKLDFSQVAILNLNQLPLDPRNGQTGNVNGTSVTFAYAFVCDANYNYEFAAKLEGPTSTMANDGGNQNCTDSDTKKCLYEVGPGRNTLY